MATQRRTIGRAGTGFVNLSDWTQANASGARRLADTLADNAQQAGTSAMGELDSLDADFRSRVQAGTLNYDTEGLNAARAAELAAGGYTGPDSLRDLSGYEDVMSNAQRAQEGAQAVGNLYGQATELGNLYGQGGNYTGGQRLLDAALAGSAGVGRFNALGQQWGGLLNRAEAKDSDALGAALEARATSNDAAERYAADATRLRREEGQAANDAFVQRSNRRTLDELNRQREGRDSGRMGADGMLDMDMGEDNLPNSRRQNPKRTGGYGKRADDFFKGW